MILARTSTVLLCLAKALPEWARRSIAAASPPPSPAHDSSPSASTPPSPSLAATVRRPARDPPRPATAGQSQTSPPPPPTARSPSQLSLSPAPPPHTPTNVRASSNRVSPVKVSPLLVYLQSPTFRAIRTPPPLRVILSLVRPYLYNVPQFRASPPRSLRASASQRQRSRYAQRKSSEMSDSRALPGGYIVIQPIQILQRLTALSRTTRPNLPPPMRATATLCTPSCPDKLVPSAPPVPYAVHYIRLSSDHHHRYPRTSRSRPCRDAAHLQAFPGPSPSTLRPLLPLSPPSFPCLRPSPVPHAHHHLPLRPRRSRSLSACPVSSLFQLYCPPGSRRTRISYASYTHISKHASLTRAHRSPPRRDAHASMLHSAALAAHACAAATDSLGSCMNCPSYVRRQAEPRHPPAGLIYTQSSHSRLLASTLALARLVLSRLRRVSVDFQAVLPSRATWTPTRRHRFERQSQAPRLGWSKCARPRTPSLCLVIGPTRRFCQCDITSLPCASPKMKSIDVFCQNSRRSRRRLLRLEPVYLYKYACTPSCQRLARNLRRAVPDAGTDRDKYAQGPCINGDGPWQIE